MANSIFLGSEVIKYNIVIPPTTIVGTNPGQLSAEDGLQLVPDVHPNYILELISAIAIMNFGGEAYDVTDLTKVAIFYTGDDLLSDDSIYFLDGATTPITAIALLGSASRQVYIFNNPFVEIPLLPDKVGKGFSIGLINGGAWGTMVNPGLATGSLELRLSYLKHFIG